jgi:hypothetical protein
MSAYGPKGKLPIKGMFSSFLELLNFMARASFTRPCLPCFQFVFDFVAATASSGAGAVTGTGATPDKPLATMPTGSGGPMDGFFRTAIAMTTPSGRLNYNGC